jgi:RNase H-fold protein (predicted Holliday junction resolvase)
MRAIGLDLGSKRIGVAVSDFSGTIASPHSVIHRSKSVRLDHQKILDLVIEEEAEMVVMVLQPRPPPLRRGDSVRFFLCQLKCLMNE